VAAASQPRSAYDDTSRRAFAHAPRREHVIALTRRGSAAAHTDGDSP
jgi:hypothetical protein